MTEINTIGSELTRQAPALARAMVDEWHAIARQEQWQSLPTTYTWDSLDQLVTALCAAALLEADTRPAQERLVDIAIRHGEDRFLEGFDEMLIYREYQMLRNAMWLHIRTVYGASGAGAEAIIRIDALTTTAARASLIGFHRPQLEVKGRFETARQELLEGLPRLGR